MIVISACLCGVDCKYNGKNNFNEKAMKLFREGKAILVCPEQLGGLTTPRVPHEIYKGTGADVLDSKAKVISRDGKDCTDKFVKGAYEALKIAKSIGAKRAILKSKSPSCGCGIIYDGSFRGITTKGNGVTAELFLRNGIEVITEEALGK
ncbi:MULTISPECIES: DUF523 domain-containing protein [Clostridium]|jgi:uncharacterized protein YbbK (DUF523 family)|uniref:Uncharacterized protein n=2 Tax=Clostridium TaxID=1485 RepID=A0A151AS08_9CLOT|nr:MULTISPECIES: DUF523 domain-containing protein [Clostridium]KYH30167.1 hypothetical protein CLCOL_01050 [Clostridium colicanis DSM 13634]MBE6044603.1 DUF523 domain-containing protein [Clostridium thermopalmarium]PRR74446.1 hypothetical protein CPAL_08810 [Clostridium thermopalmarium DSM 5974]PVZ15831.1 uncharacterized protein YbbK (DUF523 family) [Clostridium thermopalmarium DSM 5974]